MIPTTGGRNTVTGGGSSGWGGEERITRSAWLDGSADYLTRTLGSPTDATRWIYSGWWRPCEFQTAGDPVLLAADASVSNYTHFRWFGSTSPAQSVALFGNSGIDVRWNNELFRDIDWIHFLLSFDSNEATAADRISLRANGVVLTPSGSPTYPSSAATVRIGTAMAHFINRLAYGSTSLFHGKVAQQALLIGDSLQNGVAVSSFGEFITVGTNGQVWAPVSDATVKAAVDLGESAGSVLLSSDIGDGTDDSVHGNNWTATSITDAANGSEDSPSDPDLVFSLLHKPGSTLTLSEGGQVAQLATGVSWVPASILVPPTGKWYVELRADTVSGSNMAFGVCHPDAEQDATPRGTGFLHWEADGDRYLDGSQTATEVTGWSATDVVGLGINMDDREVGFYDNAGNLDATVSLSANIDNERGVLVYMGQLSGSGVQKGAIISNTADFTHSVPTDYSALRLSNLPAPSLQGVDHFNALIYTGNGLALGSGGNAISGMNFQPDIALFKDRDSSTQWQKYDSSRGPHNAIYTDSSGVESTEAQGLDSFDSDGVTVGSSSGVNASSSPNIVYGWKANGGTTASNNNGTITTTAQVSPDGFCSILEYTGNGTAGATIGHGLTAVDMYIIKCLTTGYNWIVGWPHLAGVGNSDYFMLDVAQTKGGAGAVNWANSVVPSSTVISLGSDANVNQSGQDYVCYAFKDVSGAVNIGKYVGNGNSDGPAVVTGFRPRFLLIKGDITSQEWGVYDTAREEFNDGSSLYLQPDTTSAEGTDFKDIDILANGFKVRDSSATINSAGVDYYYLAIGDVAGGSGLPPVPGR